MLSTGINHCAKGTIGGLDNECHSENIVTVGSVVTVELVVTTYQVMLVVTNLDPGYADLVVSR